MACPSLVGYGEIRQRRYAAQSTLMHALDGMEDARFVRVVIGDRADVYPALQTFFGPDAAERP